jgi:hypothetical protein
MHDEMRFVIEPDEGERHPSDGRELREIAHLLKTQNVLLHEILNRLPKPTYFQPTGGSITVS